MIEGGGRAELLLKKWYKGAVVTGIFNLKSRNLGLKQAVLELKETDEKIAHQALLIAQYQRMVFGRSGLSEKRVF